MGRIFLVEYERTPDARLYICAACQIAPIAKQQHLVIKFGHNNKYGSFEQAVNFFHGEPAPHSSNLGITGTQIYCVQCGFHIGEQVVDVKHPDHIGIVARGRIILGFEHLLFWNGNEIVHAYTPPENV